MSLWEQKGPHAIVLRLLWEAFFLIGFWEAWRVESGSEPLGEHLSMVYRWLQLMWLQLEVVGGPVGVDLGRFGAL